MGVEKEITDLESRLEQDPQNLEVLHKLGNLFFDELGDIEKAESYYKKMLSIESVPAAHHNLAMIFEKRKIFPAAKVPRNGGLLISKL